MSAILMSIKPEYVSKIFDGTKKFEYRKTKCKDTPDKIIVYCSYPVKKVVGELFINDILYDNKEEIWNKTYMYSGIDKEKYDSYFKNTNYAVAYKINKCIKYNKPKDLNDYGIKYAPQSYIYLK